MSHDKRLHIPAVDTYFIDSIRVTQRYRIQVMQPLMNAGASVRFPVLFLTDGNIIFDAAKAISYALQSAGQVCPFILVGIGYPGDNPFAGDILRRRDLTSLRRPRIENLPMSSPIQGIEGFDATDKDWHGGADFLAFMRHELIPSIDARYLTLVSQRGYFGHSLGGSLGLHALFSEGDLFNRYILASPGITYGGNDYGLKEAREFVTSGRTLDAEVFIAVGGKEEFEASVEKSCLVSSVFRLAALLRGAAISGLRLDCQVLADETHASVWSLAFSRGIRALYKSGRSS